MCKAGHVINVEEIHSMDCPYITIQSKVIRQTSVTATPYITKLEIDSNRQINTVYCNCKGNQSKKCKHVAALIYFINNDESKSQTGREQMWVKPSITQYVKEKYSKGATFGEMFKPKHRRIDVNPVEVELIELKPSSVLAVMMKEEQKDVYDHSMQVYFRTIQKNQSLNAQKNGIECYLDDFLINKDEFEIYCGNVSISDTNVLGFFNKNINLTKDDIKQLCYNT